MVDLDDPGVRRIKVAIGEVGAQHDQGVAVHHGVIAGREADQAGHAHVEGIVPFDVLLAAQGVNHRRLKRLGQGQHLIMGAGAAAARQDGDLLGPVQQFGGPGHIGDGGGDARLAGRGPVGRGAFRRRGQSHIAGQDDHRYPALADGGVQGARQDARHLGRIGHQFAEVAAFAEQLLRMGLLEIAQADL